MMAYNNNRNKRLKGIHDTNTRGRVVRSYGRRVHAETSNFVERIKTNKWKIISSEGGYRNDSKHEKGQGVITQLKHVNT